MYRRMRYFLSVVDTGSFYEAGEACHISQSAVSQQIKALEEDLGVKLLERHGRSFSVTPAGQYFYQYAARQTAQQDSFLRELRRIDSGEYRRLRVGVLNSFSAKVIERTARAFAATHPHVRLTLTTGTHEQLFRPITSGEMDLVVNDQWRALSEHFVNEPLVTQPLFALTRADDPCLSEGRLDAEALQDRFCILAAPNEHRESEVDHWRGAMGLDCDFLFVENTEEARMNAAAGNGFCICDADMPSGEGTALVPLYRGGAPLVRRIYAFWPESSDSSLQREFTALLRAGIK